MNAYPNIGPPNPGTSESNSSCYFEQAAKKWKRPEETAGGKDFRIHLRTNVKDRGEALKALKRSLSAVIDETDEQSITAVAILIAAGIAGGLIGGAAGGAATSAVGKAIGK
ncbi:hypothetical protein MRX96_030331 [Rhipicephalus microplus]